MAPSVTAASRGSQASIMDEERSLARVVSGELLPDKPITDPRSYQGVIERLTRDYNVIAPPIQLSGAFMPGFQMQAAMVVIDTHVNDDGQGSDTYFSPGFMKAPKRGDRRDLNDPSAQRALSKNGLNKLLAAAGVKWTETTGRRDDGKVQYVWSSYAEGIVDTPDGQYRIVSGSEEVDLRDGSAQIGDYTPDRWAALMRENDGKPDNRKKWSINGWSEQRVRQARAKGLALAETKAKNRAIRELGVHQVYTVAELQKPFIIFRAAYVPNMSNPQIEAMVAERFLHGRRTLNPAATAVEPLSTPGLPPPGTIDVSTVDSGASTGTPRADSSAPAPLTVVDIVQVEHEGQKRLLWDIRFSDGRVARTNDEGIRNLARAAHESHQPVEVVTEKSAKRDGLNVLELRTVGPSDEDLY
jgi:hypothetical protein